MDNPEDLLSLRERRLIKAFASSSSPTPRVPCLEVASEVALIPWPQQLVWEVYCGPSISSRNANNRRCRRRRSLVQFNYRTSIKTGTILNASSINSIQTADRADSTGRFPLAAAVNSTGKRHNNIFIQRRRSLVHCVQGTIRLVE